MAEEKENLSQEQIGDLIRRLLGPPEDWDDDAAEFILTIQGTDPATSGSYVKDLILSELEDRRLRRMEIPPILLRMLSSFSDEAHSEDETTQAERYLRLNFPEDRGEINSSDVRLLQAGRRRPGVEATDDDEKIIKELEAELIGGADTDDADEESY